MANTSAGVFWSYSHEDDALDDGAILLLAGRLRAEYALITGEELALFVDRAGISWGDEWRSRIDNALVQTTLFVAIVSPRYFARDECRRELLTFYAQCESLGVTELLLPILYVTIPDFTNDNPDEAIAIAARTQYTDWRQLRLEAHASPDYRKAVNALAQRLACVAATVADRQVAHERETTQGPSVDPDLHALSNRLAGLLPDWLDVVETDPVFIAQQEATFTAYEARLEKLSGRGGARFAVLHRMATDLLPSAEAHLRLAQTYSRTTIDLNPVVVALVRAVESHPDSLDVLGELREGIDEAMLRMRHQPLPGRSIEEYARENAHVSRAMGKLASVLARGAEYTTEANDIVRQWAASVVGLEAPSDLTVE